MAELGLAARLAAVVFTALVAEGVRRADRAAAEGRFSRAFADGLWLGAWLGAALLLGNLLRTPANDFSVLAAASALAFAALAGAALSRLSAAGRAAVVAGASLLVVGRLAGLAALAMNLGACLPAFALGFSHPTGRASPLHSRRRSLSDSSRCSIACASMESWPGSQLGVSSHLFRCVM